MNISFDYDNTISADFDGWREVMNLMRNRGHTVFIVTYRDDRFDSNDQLEFLQQDDFEVYYTRGVAKKWWMQQFAPWEHKNVDVWIDDKPDTILNNSVLPVESLEEWRKENQLVSA